MNERTKRTCLHFDQTQFSLLIYCPPNVLAILPLFSFVPRIWRANTRVCTHNTWNVMSFLSESINILHIDRQKLTSMILEKELESQFANNSGQRRKKEIQMEFKRWANQSKPNTSVQEPIAAHIDEAPAWPDPARTIHIRDFENDFFQLAELAVISFLWINTKRKHAILCHSNTGDRIHQQPTIIVAPIQIINTNFFINCDHNKNRNEIAVDLRRSDFIAMRPNIVRIAKLKIVVRLIAAAEFLIQVVMRYVTFISFIIILLQSVPFYSVCNEWARERERAKASVSVFYIICARIVRSSCSIYKWYIM